MRDALSLVGVTDLYDVASYNCEHMTNNVRYGVPVSAQVENAKNVYIEATDGWSGASKLAVDIASEYLTTPEPSRLPKTIKFSDIVDRCAVEAFEDRGYQDFIATLKKVKETLNKEKNDLRNHSLIKESEESVKVIFKFKSILVRLSKFENMVLLGK